MSTVKLQRHFLHFIYFFSLFTLSVNLQQQSTHRKSRTHLWSENKLQQLRCAWGQLLHWFTYQTAWRKEPWPAAAETGPGPWPSWRDASGLSAGSSSRGSESLGCGPVSPGGISWSGGSADFHRVWPRLWPMGEFGATCLCASLMLLAGWTRDRVPVFQWSFK